MKGKKEDKEGRKGKVKKEGKKEGKIEEVKKEKGKRVLSFGDPILFIT